MSDKIKSHLTTAYMMFVFDFGDPSGIDIKSDQKALFDSQKSADRAKKNLGKDKFRQLVSLHFNAFQSANGLDHESLNHALIKNKKVYIRHLGKDKVMFLTLIVTLLKDLESGPPPRKKGLLFERASA